MGEAESLNEDGAGGGRSVALASLARGREPAKPAGIHLGSRAVGEGTDRLARDFGLCADRVRLPGGANTRQISQDVTTVLNCSELPY